MDALAAEWSAYVESSLSGKNALASRPVKPAALHTSAGPPNHDEPFATRDLGPIPAPAEVGTAARVKEVWEREGWVPAVAGPHEEERLKVLRRFGLQDVGQIEAVDKIAETARMIFGTKTVTVSCMLEDRGMFITTRGWRPEETDPRLPRIQVGLEASVCKHAVNKAADEGCFILPAAREDWRFRNNPYVRPGGPINFFASANINLPTLSLDNGRVVPSKLPIGSLCLVDPEARPAESAMSETDQKVLKNLADLIAREFELGFERRRNAVAKAQTDYLGQLFRSLNVGPSPSVANQENEAFAHVASNLVSLTSASYCAIIDLRSFQLSSGTPLPRPSRRPSADTNIPAVTPSTSFASAPPVYPTSAPSPSSRLPLKRNTSFDSLPTTSRTGSTNGSLAADGATMSGNSGAEMSLDSQPREEEMITLLSTRGGRRESDGGRFAVLDAAVAPDVDLEGWVSWDNALGVEVDDVQREEEMEETEEDARVRARNRSEAKGKAADAKRAVSAFLMDYYRSNQAHFDASSPSASLTGPLASILPSGTTAYVAVPCFFDGDATLMIVLGSTTRHFQFELADRDFAQNVGAILMGSLLRRRLLEADKAKLHFLSQISHELRTPLHGIGSYLELIRDVAQPEALATINPLLSMTDVCVTSLREILDSVLSFSKLYNADAVAALSSTSRSANGDRPTHAPITRTLVDLEELIVDVVKSCWTTTLLKSQALQGVSVDGVAAAAQAQQEKVDIILEFDLPRGTLVAADVGGLKRVLVNLLGNSLKYTSVGKVVIAVSAPKLSSRTGVEDILIDIADTGKGMSPEFVRERLFLPFSQEDPFKEGNGLGTAIADSLLRGMGGTLRYSSALGSGTTASISVPLEVSIPPSSELPPPPQSVLPRLAALGKPTSTRASVERRVLSDELSAMLHPIKLAGSPRFNKPLPVTDQPVTVDSAAHLPLTSPASVIAIAPPPADSQSLPGAFGSRLPASVLPPFSPPLTPPSLAGAGILPVPAPTEPVADPPVEAPLTVLVADDNPIARRVLTTFLRSRRIAYVEAENGAEAVAQFLAARPSLVWMDVQMPVKDGLEATQEIRAMEAEKGWQKARVVVLSGLSKELGKHEQYLKSGLVDHWITKSGSLKQLSADLEAYRSSIAAASSTAAVPPPFSVHPPAFTPSASQAAAVPPVTA